MSSPAGWSTSSSSSASQRASASPRLSAPLSRTWRGARFNPGHTRVWALLLSGLTVLAVACGGGSDDQGITIATQAPARGATPETRTPIGVPPVAPTATAPTPAPVGGGEAVAFQTADGALTFRGTLFSAPGPKRKVVVMAAFP